MFLKIGSGSVLSFRIWNTAGTWYTIVVESDGTYSFTSECRFPLDNAQPVVSANGKVDLYSLYCISATKYLVTFAFQYTTVF